MSKHTPIKGRQEEKSAASEQHHGLPAHPSAGSSRRATTTVDAPAPHFTTAADARAGHEQIAVRAYQLWEAQGRPVGTDWENWFEAEGLLRAEAR